MTIHLPVPPSSDLSPSVGVSMSVVFLQQSTTYHSPVVGPTIVVLSLSAAFHSKQLLEQGHCMTEGVLTPSNVEFLVQQLSHSLISQVVADVLLGHHD